MIAALLSLLLATSPAPADGTLNLGVGQQKLLQLGTVSRVSIGDPAIADVRQLPDGELLLTGIAEGHTSLLVWHGEAKKASYAVAVRRQDPREVISEVRALLGEREGVRARSVGDRVYLEGEALDIGDFHRVEQIVALYPSVQSLVTLSPAARKVAARSLQEFLHASGLTGVRVDAVGGTLFLQGWADSKEEVDRAGRLAAALGERVESLLTVGLRKMVMVEASFVEVETSESQDVGVDWPAVISASSAATVAVQHPIVGDGQTTANLSHQTAAQAQLSLRGRFGNGALRLLSQPKLVCASGEKAQFIAGGEVPLLLATQNQFSVDFHKFGIILKVTPTADRDGNIGAAISAEVSQVDDGLRVQANGFDVPGFRVNNVETTVTVRDGESIVLSGLYNADEQKAVSKTPLLGHIPILGELFKSRRFQEHKTQLAIYITPHLVVPGSAPERALREGAAQGYQEGENAVRFHLLD